MTRPLITAAILLLGLATANAKDKTPPRAHFPSQFHGVWTQITDRGANSCRRGEPNRDDIVTITSTEMSFVESGCEPIRFTANGQTTLKCGGEGETWTSDELWTLTTIEGVRHLITATVRTYNESTKGSASHTDHSIIYQECHSVLDGKPTAFYATVEQNLAFDSEHRQFVLDAAIKLDTDYLRKLAPDLPADATSSVQLTPAARSVIAAIKKSGYFLSATFDGKSVAPAEPTNYYLAVKDRNFYLHVAYPFATVSSFNSALITFYDPRNELHFDIQPLKNAAIPGATGCRAGIVQLDPNGPGRKALSALCE